MGKLILFKPEKGERNMYDSSNKSNLVEVAKLILYFANNTTTKLYKTKLNKLLFYTQFLYYKEFKERLIGDDFICDYHGPTIPDLDQYLYDFCNLGFIELSNTGYGTVIIPKLRISSKDYNKREKYVLEKILKKFDKFTSTEISDYSHKESLWIKTQIKDVINIERVNELNDLQI